MGKYKKTPLEKKRKKNIVPPLEWNGYKKMIPLDEIKGIGWYLGIASIASIFNHTICEDKNGTWRWLQSGAIAWIREKQEFDYNGLWIALVEGKISLESHVKLMMNIGYSLSGFLEIYEQHTVEEISRLRGNPEETLFEYLIRTYAHKELEI